MKKLVVMGTLFLSGWGVALAQTDSTATEKGATLALLLLQLAHLQRLLAR